MANFILNIDWLLLCYAFLGAPNLGSTKNKMTDLDDTGIANAKTSATAAENLSFRPSLLNRDSGWANMIEVFPFTKSSGRCFSFVSLDY
jgi:hypothetical protein